YPQHAGALERCAPERGRCEPSSAEVAGASLVLAKAHRPSRDARRLQHTTAELAARERDVAEERSGEARLAEVAGEEAHLAEQRALEGDAAEVDAAHHDVDE